MSELLIVCELVLGCVLIGDVLQAVRLSVRICLRLEELAVGRIHSIRAEKGTIVSYKNLTYISILPIDF